MIIAERRDFSDLDNSNPTFIMGDWTISLLYVYAGLSLWSGVTAYTDVVCDVALPKPWSISTIDPELWVYSRSASTSFRVNDTSQIESQVAQLSDNGYLSKGRQVVFIVHGYLTDKYYPWMYDMKDSILKQEDSTVIIVAWGYGATTPSYPQSGSNTQTIAKFVSDFAEAVLNSQTFNGDHDQLYLYCIGHSLGAQACGQAGRLSGHFDRVSGLDPAGPGFEDCWPASMHVGNDSAACVDNIHTDGTRSGHYDPFVPYYGSLNQWGRIDFYPNGGGGQPGCHLNDMACSHMRSIYLFQYTIDKQSACSATGPCGDSHDLPKSCSQSSTQFMGYHSTCHKSHKAPTAGMFYLTTGSRGDYC